MEKPRSSASSKRRNRLLTLFIVLSVWLPALLTAQNTNPLQFKQMGAFSVAENSEFIVEIVGVNPSDVEIWHSDFPPDISFVSSTKSDTFIVDKDGNRQKGTLISYIVRFLQPGTYNLGSLDVLIDSTAYTIFYPLVSVSQNPELLMPELYLRPQSDLYQSQGSLMTLTGRYFQRIESIDWNLSETALIEKSISSLPLPSNDFPFTEEITTIAIFSYTPLLSGILELPQIEASVVAYNGRTYTIRSAAQTVTVLPPAADPAELFTSGDYFAEGQSPASLQNGLSAQANNSTQSETFLQSERLEFVTKLAELRSNERNLLFPFIAKNERTTLEKTANIHNADETSVIWTIIGAVLCVPLLLAGFILYKKQKPKSDTVKKSQLPLLCFALATILFFLVTFSAARLSGQYALTLGSQLRIIPEYQASNLFILSPGMRVRIVRSGGDWYLVSLEDKRSGWILKDDCILIN